ncbi:MAG: 50S ribosomal protein L17 [Desulfobacterales bacterium]|nr:50S ribosomal protein L17 [Desulfobacterales bacterium]
MRHRKSGLKLNRTASHRKAMFRNMVTSLFKYGKIKTTDVKAKEMKRWADHIVSLAKQGDLHSRRQAMSIIREKAVVHQLFSEAPERFSDRSGGYTRITKLGPRKGDAASLSIIELTGVPAASGKNQKGEEKKKKASA